MNIQKVKRSFRDSRTGLEKIFRVFEKIYGDFEKVSKRFKKKRVKVLERSGRVEKGERKKKKKYCMERG